VAGVRAAASVAACRQRRVWRRAGGGGRGGADRSGGEAEDKSGNAGWREDTGTGTRRQGHGDKDTETRTRRQGHGGSVNNLLRTDLRRATALVIQESSTPASKYRRRFQHSSTPAFLHFPNP